MGAIIAFTLLATYTIMVCLIWGIPASLSQTWFSITHRWVFSFIMLASAALLFFTLVDVFSVQWQWVGFLCSVGSVMIGAAPNLHDDIQHTVHMTGALILGLASQGVVLLLCPEILLSWIIAIPVILTDRARFTFWIEMFGGMLMFISIFHNINP